MKRDVGRSLLICHEIKFFTSILKCAILTKVHMERKMKTIYRKLKKRLFVLMMLLGVVFVSQQISVPVCAYTQEEKEAAKVWLSDHGYSPDMGGAQAAYNDYMNGKFGAIPGLPEPNVKPEEPPVEELEEQEEEPEEKKPEEAPGEEMSEESDKAPLEEPNQTLLEEPEREPGEEPELLEADSDQQEFLDMITMFASGFSESDQEKLDEAQQRQEKQRQERVQAEKETETMMTANHNPQRQVIILFCVVLAAAVIGLGVLLVKTKKKD